MEKQEDNQPLDDSTVLVSTGVIGLKEGVLEKDTKKTVQEWRALEIDVEKFIEFGTLRPFVASDLNNGEAESIVQTIQRLTQENESLKSGGAGEIASLTERAEKAEAELKAMKDEAIEKWLPEAFKDKLVAVKGVGPALADTIVAAFTAPAQA